MGMLPTVRQQQCKYDFVTFPTVNPLTGADVLKVETGKNQNIFLTRFGTITG